MLLFCETNDFFLFADFVLYPCISAEYWKHSFKYTGVRSFKLLNVIIIIMIAGIEQNTRVFVRAKSFNKICALLGYSYVPYVALLLQVNISS